MADETRRSGAIWLDPDVRRLLDGMTEPFLALEGTGRIAFVNLALSQRRPEGETAFLGRSCREVWPELVGTDTEDGLLAAHATGVPTRFEQRMAESGRWVELSAYSNGEYLLVHYRDITEAKLREGAMRTLVDALPHIAWMIEPNGRIFVNGRHEEYTGSPSKTPEEFFSLIHPDDHATVTAAVAGRAKGEPYGYDIRIRRADGVYRWNRVQAFPYRRDPSEDLSWIGTATDVHDERTREMTLRLLLQIHEETRELGDPEAIVLAAMRALATTLCDVVCAYGEVREDEETVDILQEWPGDAMKQSGPHRISDFDPEVREGYRAGLLRTVEDAHDVYPPEKAQRYVAVGSTAYISAPLVKDGRLSALIFARSSVPRVWTPEEAESVRLVADRCWAEVERARAERRAQDREAGLRAMVEANPIGVVVVDIASGVALEANDAWLKALGRTREELEAGAIDIRAMSTTDGIAVTEARIAEVREKGSTGFYEKEYFRPDGSRVPVLVGFTPHDPEVTRATAFMLDLTDLRRAEQAVIEGERRYRALAETIPAIAFSLRPDGSVEYVNSRGQEFFGPDQSEAALRSLGESITHAESYEVERPLRRFDRQYRWHLCRAEPMRDDNGTLLRWIGTLTDIHDAKSRERVLRFLVDLDDATASLEEPAQAMREIAYMLAGAVSADRCAYAEVEGEHFTILGDYARVGTSISGRFRIDEFGEEFSRTLREGQTTIIQDVASLPIEVQTAYEAAGIAAVVAVPLIKGGKLVAGMAVHQNRPRQWTPEDVHLVEQVAERSWSNIERVRARLALRQSEEQLQTANDGLERKVEWRTKELQDANEALQGFGYHISHDLRTPLRAIVSTSRMIQADYGSSLPEEANALLARQAEAARKLGELIDDLLQLSRLSQAELTKRTVDLTALARDAAAEALSAHPESTAQIVVEDGLSAQADPRLLRLAVVNLLENAVKYSPAGGTIHVFQRASGEFAFSDEGIGMEPQYLEKIFEPFQRLHRDEAYKGTGIGLANVKRVIDRHGGDVWAESEIGKGSTFLVRF